MKRLGPSLLRSAGWLAFSALAGSLLPTQGSVLQESQVKASYLAALSKFVEWPPEAFRDANSPVVVGILGRDPFGFELDRALQTETAGGRSLEARRFGDLAHLGPCQILFIGAESGAALHDLIKRLGVTPILTVGDSGDCASGGGIVCFRTEKGEVRLEINPAAAERAGLKVSSRLLAVARIVADTGGDE